MAEHRDYPEKLKRIVDVLESSSDRTERIQLLIDMARRFKSVPEHVAQRPFPEEKKVPACESQAYVFTEELPDRTLRYHFAVENPQGVSAMAMAVILGDTLSGLDPARVASVPGDLIYDVFGRELSMGKSMGLMGMVHGVTVAAKAQAEKRRTG